MSMNPRPQDSRSATPPSRLSAELSHEKRLWGLLRRRSCLVPTLRGCVAFGLSFAVLLTVILRFLHPFLALNDPITDGLLVVEGWTPDYGLEVAVDEFERNHYQKIYVTGGPLEYGTHLTAYQTYAQLGAATLVRLGLDSNVVQAVPAPLVRQDRTYISAVSFKKWLIEHGIRPTRVHLMSDGPHARRSRLLYQKAMGDGVVVGVTSIPSKEYDQRHWWRYSAGVRNVIGEGLAYLYARFLFYPSKT
jgi:hypothetical protein